MEGALCARLPPVSEGIDKTMHSQSDIEARFGRYFDVLRVHQYDAVEHPDPPAPGRYSSGKKGVLDGTEFVYTMMRGCGIEMALAVRRPPGATPRLGGLHADRGTGTLEGSSESSVFAAVLQAAPTRTKIRAR